MKRKITLFVLLSLCLMKCSIVTQAAAQTLSFSCDTFTGVVDKHNVSLYEIFEGDRDAFYNDFTTFQKSDDGEAYVIFEIPYASSAVLTTYHLPSEAMDFIFSVSNDQVNWESPEYTRYIIEKEGKWTTYTYTFQNLSRAETDAPIPTSEPSAIPTATATAAVTLAPIEIPAATASPSPEPTAITEKLGDSFPKETPTDSTIVKGVASLPITSEENLEFDTRYLKVTWPTNPTWWTPLIAELNVTCAEAIPQKIEIKTIEPWIIPMYDTVSYPLSAVLIDQMGNEYPAEPEVTITSSILPEISYENQSILVSSEYPEGAILDICFSSPEFNLMAQKSIHLQKALLGDLNQDLLIDIKDLEFALSFLGKTDNLPEWKNYRLADINRDGIIDILDIAYIARNCEV